MISTVLPAYKYLVEQRKINEETIRTWNLGYCSPTGEIYMGADFTGKLPALDRRFYNSTIFPIFNMYGECISVSVRPLGPTQVKYINTSYEKADHLYGLHLNWKEIVKQQSVYVVEGNLSILTPWQHGIKNIVAMLGSNISYTHLCLLNRFAKKVIFCPDGDKAGTNLIAKLKKNIPEKFASSDLKFSYLELPANTDPDDFIRKFGKDSFLKLPEKELKF